MDDAPVVDVELVPTIVLLLPPWTAALQPNGQP
jgi:hypothetical protein